jgi:membrane-associated phospholipid phosphatase
VAKSAPLIGRRGALPGAAALACGLGLVTVGAAVFALPAVHDRDAAMLHGFTGLYGSRVESELRITARLVDPVPYALIGTACIGVALVRRRTARAAAIAVVLVGTGLTTLTLKHILGQPRYADWLFGDSMQHGWPSGHTAAAMTLALCAVVVTPPAWRAATALLACGFTISIAYATLALVWHYPSDVVGGLLVAGLWVSMALAVLARLEVAERRVGRRPPLLGWLVAAAGVGALVAGALVGVASGRVPLDAVDRATTVGGAVVIAALAAALLVTTVVAASEADG